MTTKTKAPVQLELDLPATPPVKRKSIKQLTMELRAQTRKIEAEAKRQREALRVVRSEARAKARGAVKDAANKAVKAVAKNEVLAAVDKHVTAFARAHEAKLLPQLDDLHTIDATYLGKLIGRSTRSIKNDVARKPESLPPRFEIPGQTRNRFIWRVADVRAWMEGLAQVQAEERLRQREFARKQGIQFTPPKTFDLAAIGKPLRRKKVSGAV